jgi:hypothetical protein
VTALAPLEAKPMEAAELGRFVCVAHGGCLHTGQRPYGRTIASDGVWVRQPGGQVASAHRDCYERWAAQWTG